MDFTLENCKKTAVNKKIYTMESTKVVSLRLPMGTYENILLECEAKGITITEWFERKIATAKKAKAIKSQIVEKMEQIFDIWPDHPKLVQMRLNRLIWFVKGEL